MYSRGVHFRSWALVYKDRRTAKKKKIELRLLSGVVTSSAENVRSSLRSRSTVVFLINKKVMEKGDMVSNDSKSYF